MFERRIFRGVFGSSATKGAKIFCNFFVTSLLSCFSIGRGILDTNLFCWSLATGRVTFGGLLVKVGNFEPDFIFVLTGRIQLEVEVFFFGVE